MLTAVLYIALTFNVKNCILEVENTRIRKTHGDEVTTFVYNTNTRLSQLLVEKKGNTITKYVYGHGLICSYTGDESTLRVYHHDYRGSTVAITNTLAETTDTFDYDIYGKLISRTGTTETPFTYNGRDGVYSDENGLIYMRARYYSPELRRFINADILHGSITDSTSLNRYAYVNGNPVSFVDPLGMEAQLDWYINANYRDKKNVTLVIDQPVPNSRDAATIENGKLKHGHTFIRLDDGDGNVQYVGFSAYGSYSVTDMVLAKNVAACFTDDSKTDWDVAKVYTLNDKQYQTIVQYIDFLEKMPLYYNIETYNCTTFAVDIAKMAGAAGNFITIYQHDWTLPDDTETQLGEYDALPNWLSPWAASVLLNLTVGNFYGYTPADAAEDLKHAEGVVLLKGENWIETIENVVYLTGTSNGRNK